MNHDTVNRDSYIVTFSHLCRPEIDFEIAIEKLNKLLHNFSIYPLQFTIHNIDIVHNIVCLL